MSPLYWTCRSRLVHQGRPRTCRVVCWASAERWEVAEKQRCHVTATAPGGDWPSALVRRTLSCFGPRRRLCSCGWEEQKAASSELPSRPHLHVNIQFFFAHFGDTHFPRVIGGGWGEGLGERLGGGSDVVDLTVRRRRFHIKTAPSHLFIFQLC